MDYPKLVTIPVWGWVFAVICPVYPLLLALVWWKVLKKQRPNSYLVAFAVMGSATFGVLALFYYPFKMFFQGFALRDLGQIFWVTFYAAQGWYLLFKVKTKLPATLIATLFFILLLLIDTKYKTFGYLSLDDFSQSSIIALFGLGLLNVLIMASILSKRKKVS